MSKTTVIHHSADFDGLFCREIACKFLPDAELIGWDFGDAPLTSDVFGQPDTIYILDLPVDRVFGFNGYPTGSAHLLATRKYKIIWIDHHKSSIESHPTDIPGYRIDGVAACRLAWQWFTMVDGNTPRISAEIGMPIRPAGVLPMVQDYKSREVNEPLAVRLAGEYDIWDKRDPDAELLQHGLRSQELTAQTWSMLLDPTVEQALQGTGMEISNSELICRSLLNQGRCLQYAKAQENTSIIQDLGFTFQWEGLTWLACNHARYNSHLFTSALRPEHDACFGFKFTGHVAGGKPSEEWSVSIYHAPGKEHHDLSLIAVKHGGGGHRGACGFRTSKLPFIP